MTSKKAKASEPANPGALSVTFELAVTPFEAEGLSDHQVAEFALQQISRKFTVVDFDWHIVK